MEIEQEENLVKSSQHLHRNTSYYNSNIHLSLDETNMLVEKSFITAGGQPELIAERIKQPEITYKSIIKYKFMNDGMWMKILIDRNDYPELNQIPISLMNASFNNAGFEFTVPINELLSYVLRVQKTREKIVPDQCKIYERKNYIYIALYKEKAGDWWQLKY